MADIFGGPVEDFVAMRPEEAAMLVLAELQREPPYQTAFSSWNYNLRFQAAARDAGKPELAIQAGAVALEGWLWLRNNGFIADHPESNNWEALTNGYDVAQICRTGHVISDCAGSHPEDKKKFCPTCGQPTVMACESCSTPIEGRDLDSIVIGFPFYAPKFCQECGAPFPWTKAREEAARDEARRAREHEEGLRRYRQRGTSNTGRCPPDEGATGEGPGASSQALAG
jgi:hypothetical protein